MNDLYLLLHLHVGMRSQKPLPMLYQPPTLHLFLVMCNMILRNLIRSCIGGKGDETTIKDQCAGHSLRLKSLFTGPTLGHRDLLGSAWPQVLFASKCSFCQNAIIQTSHI